MRLDATLLGGQERFGVLLGQIARHWRARLDRRLSEFGLTDARWVTLLHLARSGDGLTQKDLAARVGVGGPTLVRTLDRLEREGMVVRVGDVQDRRAKTVHLTAKAIPVLRLIEENAAAVRSELLDGISAAELDLCLAVFDRVAANLAATPARTDCENGHRAA
ncbi:MarR family transcriptional regulator [Roseomonas eburnea]|uniref:MarR family transcriptional regulator n=2 Tax=Acetobacteraceae TaxID=433 RepID=A0A9X9XEG1_9PROT|nr:MULTISPECIES: MarR family transcriptional regulator [Acetobacteraceae]MBR0682097.1 MarR family transcriptional regulator [Neoroseomonas eburnea]MDN3563661.1 MarR family transcriptional regulator [Paeniroseomonas aquatica]